MATSTTPKSKPTIVVQPGSGHTAYHFLQLNSKLQQYGYPVVCDQLASVNPPEPGVCDMSSDIIHIQRNLLQPLVDKGRDVVLVCHSIAGYAGGAAALAYSKKGRRAQGQAGGIVGVILIAAFMAYEDAKPIAKLPDGSWPSDYKVDVSAINL